MVSDLTHPKRSVLVSELLEGFPIGFERRRRVWRLDDGREESVVGELSALWGTTSHALFALGSARVMIKTLWRDNE